MVHETTQAPCPNCSPVEPVPHIILKETPTLLLKCTQCDGIQPHATKKKKVTVIKVIVSKGESSTPHSLTLDSDEEISIGDEFIVEDETSGKADFIIVTAIESELKRVNKARADQIQTIWGRSTDMVTAKISVTRGWQTESFEIKVPGDTQYTIGETITVGNEQFLIKNIKLRDKSSLKTKGDSSAAKYIKRIYTDSMERLEWLNRPKKTRKKGTARTGGSIIKPRGSGTWILKKKEKT